MATKKPDEPMAAVRIGYSGFILPVGQAMVAFQALSGALRCAKGYDNELHKEVWRMADRPDDVSLELVSPVDIARMTLEE